MLCTVILWRKWRTKFWNICIRELPVARGPPPPTTNLSMSLRKMIKFTIESQWDLLTAQGKFTAYFLFNVIWRFWPWVPYLLILKPYRKFFSWTKDGFRRINTLEHYAKQFNPSETLNLLPGNRYLELKPINAAMFGNR